MGIYGIFLLLRNTIRPRNALLLIASYAFYALWDGRFALLLGAMTLWGYAIGHQIERSTRKQSLLVISISLQLAVLIFFKYAGFFTEEAQRLAFVLGWQLDSVTTNLLLPLGLSFYVFQILGYHIDIYRGRQRSCNNILDFALFVAFFPKITAGPIERAAHILPQLEAPTHLTRTRIHESAFLLVWGLVLKFTIAENAAFVADVIFGNTANLQFFGLLGVLAFTLQIYADFAGYSFIAKGIAGFFGIELAWNFRQPYFASSPSSFWRRWHISLSEWFRDYVYIPLGGSRLGLARTCANLLCTMTLVGIWHGTDPTYIYWGLYQGTLLAVYRILQEIGAKLPRVQAVAITPWISIPSFFLLTLIGWALFRSTSMGDLWSLVTGTPFGFKNEFAVWRFIGLLWIPVLLMDGYAEIKKSPLALAHAPLPVRTAFYACAFYSLLLFAPWETTEFFYASF